MYIFFVTIHDICCRLILWADCLVYNDCDINCMNCSSVVSGCAIINFQNITISDSNPLTLNPFTHEVLFSTQLLTAFKCLYHLSSNTVQIVTDKIIPPNLNKSWAPANSFLHYGKQQNAAVIILSQLFGWEQILYSISVWSNYGPPIAGIGW